MSTEQDRTKIKERIAALLAKANSTQHSGEAELYFAKAAEMMEKHQIELFELGTEDPIGVTEGVIGQSGVPQAKSDVQRALCRYYGGKCVLRNLAGGKWYVDLIGPESVRITTELMTEFVWGQVRAKAKDYAADRGQNIQTATRNIAKGLVHRINLELAERAEREAVTPAPAGTSRSLVVTDATEAFKRAHYASLGINLQPLKGGPKKILQSAFEQAKGISLHRQVNTANTKRLT